MGKGGTAVQDDYSGVTTAVAVFILQEFLA